MQVRTTTLDDVKLLIPKRHGDDRGWFAEMFNTQTFVEAGLPGSFAQDNQSRSARGVLRGLHFQLGQPQGKLVRVLSGHIWDVAVDLRRGSPQFGRWQGFHLQPVNAAGDIEMLWIPEGYGHGFLVLSETADVLYKTTRSYLPAGERAVRWDDQTLRIDWPLHLLGTTPVALSGKDAQAPLLADAELP